MVSDDQLALQWLVLAHLWPCGLKQENTLEVSPKQLLLGHCVSRGCEQIKFVAFIQNYELEYQFLHCSRTPGLEHSGLRLHVP